MKLHEHKKIWFIQNDPHLYQYVGASIGNSDKQHEGHLEEFSPMLVSGKLEDPPDCYGVKNRLLFPEYLTHRNP